MLQSYMNTRLIKSMISSSKTVLGISIVSHMTKDWTTIACLAVATLTITLECLVCLSEAVTESF